MNKRMDNDFSVEQAAEQLGFTKRTIYQYIKDGRLRAYKWGRTWRIPQDAIDEFIERATQTGADAAQNAATSAAAGVAEQ